MHATFAGLEVILLFVLLFVCFSSFSQPPQKDFFGFFCTLGTGEAKKIHRFDLLHADALRNGTDIESYASQFILNIRELLKTRVTGPDEYNLLLGLSLHVLHDLLGHTNFGQPTGIIRNSCKCFSNKTYWSNPLSTGKDEIWSGSCSSCTLPEFESRNDIPEHGSYCNGPNRDSYARARWEEGYVAAFLSELQWINSFETWARELGPTGIVEKAKGWIANTEERKTLSDELKYQFDLPAFVHLLNLANGHWKGPYSGIAESFVVDIVASRSMKNKYRLYVHNISDILTSGLLSRYPQPDPKTWPNDEKIKSKKWNVVVFRLPEFKVLKPSFWSEVNPFILVTINGQPFHEAPMHLKSEMKNVYWKSFAFISSEVRTVKVKVEMWNFNRVFSNSIIDVNPTPDSDDLEFEYDILTQQMKGDVNGSYPDESNPVEVTGMGESPHGEERAAMIKFAMYTRSIGQDCDSTSTIPIECPEPPLPTFCKN